jgi:hypothetical protein
MQSDIHVQTEERWLVPWTTGATLIRPSRVFLTLEWEVEKCGEAPATQTIPQYTHYADSTY